MERTPDPASSRDGDQSREASAEFGHASADGSPRELDAEVMLRRIAERLLGEAPEAVLIGRFRVLDRLGEGGMGVVYAAEDAQLGRQVALKAIRGERLRVQPGERARLLREARALARLSHPNVVQVYEVGETASAVFVVMELVRGTTLGKWLETPRTLAQILKCFIEAGQGLAAAHRENIVHRDFKPSNALVGMDGRVRIADFGLARGDRTPADGTGPGEVGAGNVLATVAHAGTPAYMSPEQILGVPCDARSDQFSFCVALYEALYHKRPFATGELAAILEQTGRRPAMEPEAGPAPRWLRKVLARGLSIRPEDRFPSMESLLATLKGTPRTRRRVTRTILGTLALASAVTAGGMIVNPSAPEVCPNPAYRLDKVWAEPQRVAIKRAFAGTKLSYAANAATRVTAALDTYHQHWVAAQLEACEATRVHGQRTMPMLEQSTRCLDRASRSLASVLEALVVAKPAVVAGAEALVAALPDPATCLGLGVVAPHSPGGGERPETTALEELLDRARILERTHQGREAAAALAELIARSQQLGDTSHEAQALLLLGRTRSILHRDPKGAQESLHRAYDRAKLAEREDLVGEVWSELAWILGHDLDDAVQARIYLEHARSAQDRFDEPAAAIKLLALESRLLADEGRNAEATRLRREVLGRLEGRLATNHIEVLHARDEVATALAEAGHFTEAQQQRRALWDETGVLLGVDHPVTAYIEMNLGFDHFDLDEHPEAWRHLAHARSAMVATYGATNPWVATSDLRMAQIEGAAGSYVQAIARAQNALKIFSEHFPRTHRDRVTALEVLSELYFATHRFPGQLEVSRELLAIHDEGGPRLEIDIVGVLTNVGESLCELQRCGEALPYFTRLMAPEPGAAPAEGAMVAFPFFGIGRAHMARNDLALALPFLEEAYEALQANPLDRPGIRENLAAVARSLADALAGLHEKPQRVRKLRNQAKQLAAELRLTSAEHAADERPVSAAPIVAPAAP